MNTEFDKVVVLPVEAFNGQAQIVFADGLFLNGDADAEYMCLSGYVPVRYRNLFAAAPDLYEALGNMVSIATTSPAGMSDDDYDLLKSARSALKKARGEL